MWLIFCVHIIMNRQLQIKTGAFLWSRPKQIRAEKRKNLFADVAYFCMSAFSVSLQFCLYF